MSLSKNRARARAVRNALLTLRRRDGSLRHVIAKTWSVVAREGLAGVRSRVLVLAEPTLAPMPEPEPVLRPSPPPPVPADAYEKWANRFGSLRDRDIQAARQHLLTLALPDILVLAVLRRDELPALDRLLASWRKSIHPGWYAAIVAPPGLSAAESDAIRSLLDAHPRVSLLRTPEEVDAARARFAWTLLCFGRVLLNAMTAYMLVEAGERTEAEVVYADHDHMDAAGRRVDPSFKPQFSPDYAARFNYLGDCLLLARPVRFLPTETAALPGMALDAFDAMVARLVAGRRVEHVPFVLSHVLARQDRREREGSMVEDTGPGVAIIIPTRDGLGHLKACIDSIRDKTTYDRALVDIVVVDNNSAEPDTLAYLQAIAGEPGTTIERYPHPFNFAAINNLGAAATRREILVFLNNDTVVEDPRWLGKLVAYARRPDIGMVGAKLLFPDGTVQHGGCAAGGNSGTVSHLLMFADPAKVPPDHTREISIVTGACCAVRREVFEQIGGFDPILRITWNDVKFCLDCLQAGYRNVYVADPLLIHDESKTRGEDNTPQRVERYFDEAHYTRRRYRRFFFDDPSFNPNLSVQDTPFAEPPRARRPWTRQPGTGSGARPHRILVLSSVFKFGFGVAVVIQQQAARLREMGYEIVMGGPWRENELPFAGCERVVLDSPREAASYAFLNDIDLIICHTPPFFEIPAFIGGHIPVLAYDYGEPPADRFPDPVRSYLRDVERQKRSTAALTHTVAAISQAVKDETLNDDALVLGLANSHLPAWSDALLPRRDRARQRLGWQDSFVVLTVCRFGRNERAYKGLDKVALIAREFPYLHPARGGKVVWALAGAGEEEDVKEAEELGFTVFPNVPDAELAELYMAADAYMSFSHWEGYNLGIAQALAMGLPVAASDIPAHREFPVETSNSTLAVCSWLSREVEASRAGTRPRRAVVYTWEDSTARFAAVVERMLACTDAPRLGASPPTRADQAA